MVRHLSLGNGSLLVNLDDSLRLRDLYYPYAGQENHVLGKPHKIGVHADRFSWIKDWDTEPRYMQDTILADSNAVNKSEGLEIDFRDAVECDRPVFLREINIHNKEDYSREVELFFKQSFDLYGTEMGDTCFYHPEYSGVVHYKKNRYMLAEVKNEGGICGDLEQHGIYRSGAEDGIRSGNLNSDAIAQGNVDSVISIKVELEPKSSEKVYFWINTGESLQEVTELNDQIEHMIEDSFRQTKMCWRGFVESTKKDVENLQEHVRDQFKRSVLVVRGQTNDNGAITAANDSSNLQYNQDKYGYMWPRDGAFITQVMAQAGYPDLVEPFFDFCEEVIHPDGYMMHKYNPDKSLGSSWHAWIDEDGEDRLPIQEDETALVIWALRRFHEETGDREILEEKWQTLVKPAADFLYRYFDEEKSLPKPSYDLWEEKHYTSTFTVAAVYAGLKAAASIADTIGKDGSRYLERAQEIKQTGLKHLRSEDTKRYVRGIEDGDQVDSVSASLLFLERFNLADQEDEYFRNTVNAIRYDLSPDTEVGGIARYKGDTYHSVTDDFEEVPGNPWFICTLWVAQHLIDTAESEEDLEEAREYMHWTCENSLETDLFPEQVDPYTGEGKSVAPLTWSHTTFIKTALMYSDRKQEIKK